MPVFCSNLLSSLAIRLMFYAQFTQIKYGLPYPVYHNYRNLLLYFFFNLRQKQMDKLSVKHQSKSNCRIRRKYLSILM